MDDDVKAPASPAAAVSPFASKAAMKQFEEWAVGKNAPAWAVRAAKEMHRWPVGQEMSEDDFDDALDAATSHVIR